MYFYLHNENRYYIYTLLWGSLSNYLINLCHKFIKKKNSITILKHLTMVILYVIALVFVAGAFLDTTSSMAQRNRYYR